MDKSQIHSLAARRQQNKESLTPVERQLLEVVYDLQTEVSELREDIIRLRFLLSQLRRDVSQQELG
jgi:hypothetical protein